jgi:hypothetical protein
MRAALVVSLVVACGGKSTPPQSPPPQHPAPLTIEEANPPPAPAPAPHAEMVAPPPKPSTAISPTLANDLALLPIDSEMVVGVDVARIAQSQIWKIVSPAVAAKVGFIAELTKTCGFDPFATMSTVALGMKGLSPGGTAEGVLVVHGVPTVQLGACVPKITSNLKKTKSKTKVTINKETFTVVDDKNSKATVGFIDPHTVLVVLGPNATDAAWTTAKAGGGALSTSPAFMDMLHMISATDAVVALINGTTMTKAAAMGVKMKALFGSLDMTDSLTVDFRMRVSSADEAAQFTTMAKGQIANPQVKQMFDRLDITADGADVRFQIAISATKFQALAAMVGGMLGGMSSP